MQTFNCKQEIWIEASWCFGNEKTLSMLMVPMVPDFFLLRKKMDDRNHRLMPIIGLSRPIDRKKVSADS